MANLFVIWFHTQGKLPLTGIIVNRLEDTDALKNAFEISSPLIDRIVAVCQGPNEANKWVELLNANNPSLPMGIKRQLSNLSNSSLGHLNAAHVSSIFLLYIHLYYRFVLATL